MDCFNVVVDSYFDGHVYHHDGPYCIIVKKGSISSIVKSSADSIGYTLLDEDDTPCYKVPFLMPGLVEAHCHLFLNGSELDFKIRSEYLKASAEEMMAVARKNVFDSLAHGITLIRDAGDKYNINHRIKDEFLGLEGCYPNIRSPGLGLRSPKRYGSFMASEVENKEDITRIIDELSNKSDDLKIILTGIIDFEAGCVKGEPQFDIESLQLIVNTAREYNLPTFAHCSGMAGLELAVEAGVDSVEHGFFITRAMLERMADKGIAWVPTFSPVHFQWARPELAGWNDDTVENLYGIVESHKAAIAQADEIGVAIVAGSDAGSQGVPHGKALIDELFFLLESGLSLESVLRAATSTPRALWGELSADLRPGNNANFVALGGDPFKDSQHLRNVQAVYKGGFKLIGQPGKDTEVVLPLERGVI
jgi:imidazolonepropionase-like amidohydrolase